MNAKKGPCVVLHGSSLNFPGFNLIRESVLRKITCLDLTTPVENRDGENNESGFSCLGSFALFGLGDSSRIDAPSKENLNEFFRGVKRTCTAYGICFESVKDVRAYASSNPKVVEDANLVIVHENAPNEETLKKLKKIGTIWTLSIKDRFVFFLDDPEPAAERVAMRARKEFKADPM